MTGPDDAIPVIPSTDSREPELERAIRRGSFLGRVADFVGRGWIAIRKSVVAAAPVLLVLAAAIGGWWVYSGWRIGRIELTTEGEPVVVQVLAEQSETTIGAPFDLASRAVVTLPAGEYRLRVDGTGRLGRTYRFAVNRGETQSHAISIDEGRLLGGERALASERKTGERDLATRLAELLGRDKPKREKAHRSIPFAPGTAALELSPGKADLIEWTAGSFICRDGATGAVIWDALHPSLAFAGGHDPTPFLAKHFLREAARRSLVEPAPDLDGDGTGDLLLNLRSDGVFVAISGENGSLLWNHIAEFDGPANSTPSELDWMTRSMREDATAGEPAMTDIDRDGTPDLIATFLISVSSPDYFRRIVVGISGRTGKSLWTYRVDKSAVKLAKTSEDRAAVLIQGRESAHGCACRRRGMDRARPGDGQAAGGADRPGLRSGLAGATRRPGWRRRARGPRGRTWLGGRAADTAGVFHQDRPGDLGRDHRCRLRPARRGWIGRSFRVGQGNPRREGRSVSRSSNDHGSG